MTAPKLLGSARLKLRIALASLAVLAIGALIAPRAVPTALSAPEERAAPLLEEQTQNRSLTLPFAGVTDVLDEVRDTIVAIPPPESALPTVPDYAAGARRRLQPVGFGVVVSLAGLVLTHAAAWAGVPACGSRPGRTGSSMCSFRCRPHVPAGPYNVLWLKIASPWSPSTGTVPPTM